MSGVCTSATGEVSTAVLETPMASSPDLCPDFILCPKYVLTDEVWIISRQAAEYEYTSSFVPALGGALVEVQCQRRHKLSNEAGDELGPWTAWANVHTSFDDDHHFPPQPFRHVVLAGGITQGTWWLVQIQLRESGAVAWEIHPKCGKTAHHLLTSTFTEPPIYDTDLPVLEEDIP